MANKRKELPKPPDVISIDGKLPIKRTITGKKLQGISGEWRRVKVSKDQTQAWYKKPSGTQANHHVTTGRNVTKPTGGAALGGGNMPDEFLGQIK